MKNKKQFIWFLIISFCLLYSHLTYAADLPPGFQETTVVSGLSVPVGLEFLPDGRMLVIEQSGKVRLVINDILQTGSLLDITADVLYGGEQGLLGIAIDPDYPTRPYIYLYYNNNTPNLQYVVRYTLTGTLDDSSSNNLAVDTSSSMYLLNDIPNDATNHNGGTLRFGPDKTLFISVGDDASSCSAQDTTSLKGVILRILVDDSVIIDQDTLVADKASLVPSDNPWASSTNENERLVWAYGLRNPFRFTVDQETGRLFIADVGLHTREEIDMSVGGENFGWPYWEGTVPGPNQSCGGDNGTMPIYDVDHDPAESPVCGPAYHGTGYPTNLSFPPEYEGLVFFTDFYEGFLRALSETDSGSWELVSPMNLSNGDFGSGLTNPSDLIMGPDGALYYTTHWNGQVRKIGYYPNMGSDPDIDDDNDGFTENEGDCNDDVESINPGASETCDEVDNNCDGNVDEGVTTTYYADNDNDSYGNSNISLQTCTQPTGYVTDNTDCDDSIETGAEINPDAIEVCDGLDNNCNDSIDEGLGTQTTTCGVGECASTGIEECINGVLVDSCTPGTQSSEVCDGLDNNCDGSIDEGIGTQTTICGVGECVSTGIEECIDGALVDSCSPGTPSSEVCDGLDNNCDGSVDEGIGTRPTACGVGECASTGTEECINGVLIDTCTLGAPTDEVCDGLDNDCDGSADKGLQTTTYYADNDNDTYGNPDVSQVSCTQPSGFVIDNTDCDDADASINPGASEILDNGIDEDCDGSDLYSLPFGFDETTVISGLSAAVGLEFLPDGRMLVIEQSGKVRLVVNDILQIDPILDITADVLYGGEQGLLGIAIDPDYPTRPYIYLYYNNNTPNLQYVVRYTLTGTLDNSSSNNLVVDTSSSVYLLNDIPNNATNHNGGTLRFGPDKTLFISVGDDASSCSAQDRTSLKGVILRILVDDSVIIGQNTLVADKASLVPSDNPWASSTNENERLVWAYGLRNPFRFTVDQQTGKLFIADVGLHTREEIDMSFGGENFGWPYWEGTVPGPNQSCGGDNGTMPIYDVDHDPAESPVCGPAYHGTGYPTNLSFPPEYEGMIFFTDYFEGFLRALSETESGSWELVSPMNLTNGDFGSGLTNPSDLIMGPDGALYYTTHWNGQVRKIGYYPNMGSDPDIDDDNDGFTENEGDCDDTNPDIYPGATEIPDNGIDEDCDGSDEIFELTCTFSISTTSQNFGSNGGTGSVSVITPDGCEWTAVSNVGWITINSGNSYIGAKNVSYSVLSNTDTSNRTGTMTIAGQTFTVTQESAPGGGGGDDDDDGGGGGGGGGGGSGDDDEEEPDCEYSISSEEETFTSGGGTGSLNVSTEDGCDWTATSNNGWIFITSGSGSGVGTIEYSVSEYTGESSRTSYFTITGDDYEATVTVTQEGTVGGGGGDDDDGGGGGGDQCVYSLSSTEESFTADSDTGNLNVTTDDGCEWTTVSNDSWITITSDNSGTGSGTVEYSVLENTGIDLRTGYITITGDDYTETFKVTQAAPESLNPDIKANNSDGPITIGTDENLSIEISLSAADHAGEECDWWLVASTPSGLESYDLAQGFVPGLAVTYQGAIFDLGSYTILNTSGLTDGAYVYYFGIDMDMDGDLDMDDGLLYLDSVEVTIEEEAGLSIPTGFTASADGTTVTLSWDAVDEAEGYMLYYGYSSEEYSGTFDLGNSTGMVFENVPEGTYYVVITAYTGTEESGYSEEERVTVR